jgi:predicted metalloprotease with PDZ domain
MYYKISASKSDTHFLEIEFRLENIKQDTIEVQLPTWRPGRYELQNFAKNIQSFLVFDENNQALLFKKIKKDRWLIQTKAVQIIFVRYNYYANKQDAGNSFVDENMLYVNPVNCCIYAEGYINKTCELILDVPKNWQIATGANIQSRTKNSTIFNFLDFYHLADCPIVASPHLQHDFYYINQTKFNLWFLGDMALDMNRIKNDFEQFTTAQINVFGAFPEPDYHFMTWILPTPFYHGVEHRNSTMMVLGPNTQPFEDFYIDLLGLASHELFHAWNICKIRPKELLPYDFTQENYFETCYVAEGITTYYGDEMLRRSGVFSESQYQQELEVCLKRHFENADLAFQSLAESSYDLWLDGYSASIPNRKVSVYHKGAIVAMILDDIIKTNTNNNKNLDDVMLLLWERFGKPFIGYSQQDYQAIAEEIAGCDLTQYFKKCVQGNESLFDDMNAVLEKKYLKMSRNENNVVKLNGTF